MQVSDSFPSEIPTTNNPQPTTTTQNRLLYHYFGQYLYDVSDIFSYFAPENKQKTETKLNMNRKLLLLLSSALLPMMQVSAQKTLYIPDEWKSPSYYFGKDSTIYKESDPENKYTWSKSRSKESENFIVYWDKNYGNTNPSDAPATYRVNIDELLKKAEKYYPNSG